MNKTQPAITESFYCQVGPADVAEWPVSRLVEWGDVTTTGLDLHVLILNNPLVEEV